MRILHCMTERVPEFATAAPVPRLRVADPTLAAAVPTAMILVDYAFAGLTTPTQQPRAAAEALSTDVATTSRPLRAALAHGTALRSVLLTQLPAAHRGHHDWPALRRWLERLSDDRVLGLVEFGVRANLALGKPGAPAAADVSVVQSSITALRRDTVAVLRGWKVPAPTKSAAQLMDAEFVRQTLIALLDAIWDVWLRDAWSAQLSALQGEAQRAPVPPAGCGGAQWISLVTGLRPDTQYAAVADTAAELVLVPCPGLGSSLSLVAESGRTWVLYSPQTAGRSGGIALSRLVRVAPTMQALGDRTRLAIALHLAEHGPQSMPQLAAAVDVHQSTISRQVATLREAGVVELDSARRIVVNRDAIRQACAALLKALD
jgi:DNA-binding transcriptional ArsR family regulator